MARKSTHTFVQSKMNKDLDARLLEAGQYRDAKNVAVSRSDSDDVGALENVLGNRALVEFPSNFFENLVGTKVALGNVNALGWCFNEDKDEIFVFVTNYKDDSDSGDTKASPTTYHAILAIKKDSTGDYSATTLVEGSFLNFSLNNPILDPQMIEDLLFFTDNRNQPRKINVELAKTPGYYTNEDQISVAKFYPNKCMDILEEVQVTAYYIDKDDIPGSGVKELYKQSFYDYFILEKNTPQDVIDKLFMQIGMDGYIESDESSFGEGLRFTFKLALLQQDGWVPEDYLDDDYMEMNGTQYPPTANWYTGFNGATSGNCVIQSQSESFSRLPGNLAGSYILFINRDFASSSSVPALDFIPKTTIDDLASGSNNVKPLTLYFKLPKSLNVADPWRQDHQITLTANQVNIFNDSYSGGPSGPFSEIRYSQCAYPNTVNNLPNLAAWNLYMFGTRSNPLDWNVYDPGQLATTPGQFTEPPYINQTFGNLGKDPMARWSNGPVFKIDNLFSGNQGLARHGWMRVINPKIPDEDILVITNVRAAYSRSTKFQRFSYTVQRLTGLVGGVLENLDLKEEYGIGDGDIFKVLWPNVNYDAEFSGNSTYTRDKFIRFSYRFKFDDGEYSLLAPFTQNVFIPKQDGYFLKQPDKINIRESGGPVSPENLTPQIQQAGQNTIVDFFENKVQSVNLSIPTEGAVIDLRNKLHVKEIDIIYKESGEQAVRVLKTLNLNELNSNSPITYTYNSEEPIKTLDSKEISRVYDNVPVKAKTQAVSGNRIIYGNFLDKHTSPLSLPYSVGVSPKYSATFKDSSNAYYSYPNSTLKQNRTYQVGIVLSDRYGRSSDVILAQDDLPSFEKQFQNGIDPSSGDWFNSPISFGNSTVYSQYFDNVTCLFNSNQNEVTSGFSRNPTAPNLVRLTPDPNAGIVTWRGDSLKIGFKDPITVVPDILVDATGGVSERNIGYPGLYTSRPTNPGIEITGFNRNDASGESISKDNEYYLDPAYQVYTIICNPVVGSSINFDVNDIVNIDFTGLDIYPGSATGKALTGEAVILGINRGLNNVSSIYQITVGAKPTDPSLPDFWTFDPSENYQFTNIVSNPVKPLGWYSYRIVVKQKEQDYYNVYLPSLLKGNPIPKPFKLFIETIDANEFPNGTKILTIDNTKHPIPQTFPILEGMMLTLENDKKFYVSNILNDTQFEVTKTVAIADIATQTVSGQATTKEYEFEALSNGSTLNCATLLTDNANKIPPALNEVTPVQQQFSTSTVRLIPRVALPGDRIRVNWNSEDFSSSNGTLSANAAYDYKNQPQSSYGSWTFPIYPIRGKSLKVKSIGNFENLFVDGKYNGLYQADTNPPTGVFQNEFNIGRAVEDAKPSNEEMYQEAVFETTPTVSNLEIFYESSTSGLVEDLNFISNRARTIEVDYYNSYWLKRIKVLNPLTSYEGIPGMNAFDFVANNNEQSFGGRGVGSSPSLGNFPLSSSFHIPTAGNGQQNVTAATNTQDGMFPMLRYDSDKDNEPFFIRISQSGSQSNYNFYLEESRIRGGFNNTQTDLGARAFLDQDNPTQQNRFNSLIYSGVFNSRTGINRTNEFPTGEVLTRSANPENGSIQKLYSEEGNLLVLQENKCNRALIDKDTIYTSEGGTQTQAAGTVIGQITPYKGNYGISNNPESFAIYGFRKYFADVNRGCMLRLSNDGLTEISEYGMRDYFRDNLARIENKFNNEFVIEIDASLIKEKQEFLQTFIVIDGTNAGVIKYLKKNAQIGSIVKTSLDQCGLPTRYLTAITDNGNSGIGNNPLILYFSEFVPFGGTSGDEPPTVFLTSKLRSYIIGGWDIYNKHYVASLQYNKSSKVVLEEVPASEESSEEDEPIFNIPTTSRNFEYDTLSFDETILGWPSFYDYRPGLIGSMKNVYYTINNDCIFSNDEEPYTTGIDEKIGLYQQFTVSNSGKDNRSTFYGKFYPSHVTIIANQAPSSQKTFIAIDYEGSNGWKASTIFSDETGLDNSSMYVDETNNILSYNSTYVDAVTGYTLRPGFDRKDNRYVANLVNASQPMPGEIIFGDKMTGIKGYYAEVKMTDDSVNPGDMLELYQVGVSYNITAT